MNTAREKPIHDHAPRPGEEIPLPDLEEDETVPPRPEEEIADRFRDGPEATGLPGPSD
ncbi:hypothetical protein [Brachybacterium aquaticum]|uniref:Uncharacterized protein n=1 Tax=Brachybacterium aquaticum TaxID=1432564 RepID=A0A841A6D2_9MICO|nr:hypothetical protein [Brachybacterium aquaticum]MBB5830729.1 hypothetical protein [Brachybacterium aquaticum]